MFALAFPLQRRVQVFKPLIGRAEDPIIKRSIGRKQTQIIYTKDGSSQRVKTIETKETDKVKRCFSDEDAKILAEWCVKIEEHYSKLHGHKCPMDIGKYTIFAIVPRNCNRPILAEN